MLKAEMVSPFPLPVLDASYIHLLRHPGCVGVN